jgi:hypothetical protein
METLFSDRLNEEKKTGNLQPNTEDVAPSGNAAPPPPSDNGGHHGGRGAAPAVDMKWEAPPGEISQRNERRATSTAMRAAGKGRDAAGQPLSLAEEMAEYAAPAGGTQVARRRTGESPRRPTSAAGNTAIARSNSRSEMRRPPEAEEYDSPQEEELPPPRRSSTRQLQVEEEDEPPAATRARASRVSALAIDARGRAEEDPDEDPERTRLPPSYREREQREPEPDPEDTVQPPPRRRTGHVSRVQPATEPAQAPRRRTSSRVDVKGPPSRMVPQREREDDEEERPERRPQPEPRVRAPINKLDLLKKVFMGLIAVAMAIMIVLFWPKLMRKPIDGMGVFVSVDTNPKVNVRVRHSDKCGSPEPFTDLGMTPLKGMPGAHIQDTLILENKEQGVYAEEEEALRFGEPGETKNIKREFRMGYVKLKVTPRSVSQLKILREGQDLGVYTSQGAKLELMEGTHTLELRGDQLKAPVQVEVTVKARETSEAQVDVSKELSQ